VLITKVSGEGLERTWRLPVATRIAGAVCMGVIPVLPALWLALALVTNQVRHAGWIALAAALPAWGLLAWRALAQSVTLTPHTLVIRNILATWRLPLADVTQVYFRRGRLTVTSAHAGAASERHAVNAAYLGPARWSGLRGEADAIAEAIAGAAGLPPLPPRREIISSNWAWILLLAAALFFGLGVYWGPLQNGSTHLPFALREGGSLLYALGIGLLVAAFRITRDHQRKRD
jgi:hypothetical protein